MSAWKNGFRRYNFYADVYNAYKQQQPMSVVIMKGPTEPNVIMVVSKYNNKMFLHTIMMEYENFFIDSNGFVYFETDMSEQSDGIEWNVEEEEAVAMIFNDTLSFGVLLPDLWRTDQNLVRYAVVKDDWKWLNQDQTWT